MVRRPPGPVIPPVFKPPDDPPPHDDPLLTRATVTFHTNDDDKDHDTNVGVYVLLRNETIAYIYDEFGHFDDHTDAGPFTLLMVRPLGRDQLKRANVVVGIDPLEGPLGGRGDTWRFSFLLDLFFKDGGHLIARASNLELSTWDRVQQFGIE